MRIREDRSFALLSTALLFTLLVMPIGVAMAGNDDEGDDDEADDRFGGPVQVTGESPFLDCTADFIGLQPGEVFLSSEVEPWIVANPTDPDNLVGTWQQDRWSNGGARGLAVASSFDGGMTWRIVPLPKLTLCTGGEFSRASDPWLAFTPDGDLFHMALAFDGNVGRTAMLVQRSTDGGLSWSDPETLIDEVPPFFNDKNTLTADPTDPDLLYATWDRLDFAEGTGPAVLSRSADGGRSWEPIRVIHDPGPIGQTIGNQIVVLPDGTVIDFFTEFQFFPFFKQTLAYKLSFDKGESWLPPGFSLPVAAMLPTLALVEPDTLVPVRAADIIFDVAVDPNDGTLYAVWTDARFNGLMYDAIVLSVSHDGGLSWTGPLQVNQTPSDIAPLNRQAFIPSVHVNDAGVVAVTYYDFRFNGDEPQALTDHWAVTCAATRNDDDEGDDADSSGDCTDRGNWSGEIRLSSRSFDILQAPLTTSGLFVGDYVGLTSGGDRFHAFFSASAEDDPASVFLASFEQGPDRDDEGDDEMDGGFESWPADRSFGAEGVKTKPYPRIIQRN